MLPYLIALIAVVTAAAAVLLRRMVKRVREQERLVARVRTTALYGHVYPLFQQHDSEYIESLTFRPDGITLRLFEPLGEEIRYTFAKHDLDDPNDETLFALAQAATVDLSALRSEKNYTFRIHTEEGKHGTVIRWYDYLVKPAHKSMMLRLIAKKREEGAL